VIVLDASVVVEILLQSKDGLRIQERVLDRAESRHAPHLLDVEVIQVVRRYWLAGRIDLQRAGQMLDDLSVMPIERHAHTVLLSRIWELRANLTAYDAAYVALAEALGAPLLTRDEGLASVQGHDAAIELV
jgi:predicted nucleic acid-binding protein